VSTALAKPEKEETAIAPDVLEQVIIHGNLKSLNPQQKVAYYNAVCNAAGLDARLNPFEYMTLNGKELLYAKKSCTDQLRNNRRINVQIVSREKVGDCYVVTARAMTPQGREDESVGAVNIANAKGDNLANALMKAETKAKRRVTLSICGLGVLDETELETIPAYREDAKVSLKDKLRGTQAEGLVNAVQETLGGVVVLSPEEEAVWMGKFYAACSARGMDQGQADAIYTKATSSPKFKAAYDADPVATWEKLIAAVEAGKYDQNKAA
jgi:hypothetical protein